jgi:hypothetical protein
VSTAVVVAYGVLAVVRRNRSRRALAADLAEVQPKVDAYLRELNPAYAAALVRIRKAVASIEDQSTRTRLKRQRDGWVSHFVANRGLNQGQVPLFMNKKELGEFQLFAVAEPLLGGGPYPKTGRRRMYA